MTKLLISVDFFLRNISEQLPFFFTILYFLKMIYYPTWKVNELITYLITFKL